MGTRGVPHSGNANMTTSAFSVGVIEGVQTSSLQIVQEDDPSTCWNGLPAGFNNCTCGVFTEQGDSGITETLLGDTFVSSNEWHYMAWVYDGTNLTYYLDGHASASAKCPGVIAEVNCTVLGLATELVEGDGYFTGVLDTVALWDVPRTKEQLNVDLTKNCSQLRTESKDGNVPTACYGGRTTDNGFTLLDDSANGNNCALLSRILEVQVSHECIEYNLLEETGGAEEEAPGPEEAPEEAPTLLLGPPDPGQCPPDFGDAVSDEFAEQVCALAFSKARGGVNASAVQPPPTLGTGVGRILPGNQTVTPGFVAPFRSLAQSPISLACRTVSFFTNASTFVYTLPTNGVTADEDSTAGDFLCRVQTCNRTNGLVSPVSVVSLSDGVVVGSDKQSGNSAERGSGGHAPPTGYFGGEGTALQSVLQFRFGIVKLGSH